MDKALPMNPPSTVRITGISDPDLFSLSVRDTNNLVRYLYTSGWISYDEHADVHAILDKMIAWLEGRGVRVDMNMDKM